MREFDLMVLVKCGLCARHCVKIVELIGEFKDSEIFVTAYTEPESRRVNAKSVPNLMMLAVPPRTRLHFEVSGSSEEVEREVEQKLTELLTETFPLLYDCFSLDAE